MTATSRRRDYRPATAPFPGFGTLVAQSATTLRLLVSGSRFWPDTQSAATAHNNVISTLREGLEWAGTHPVDGGQPRTLTVVHGAAKDGIDQTAHLWCVLNAVDGVIEEAHPASKYGHPLKRDDALVELGADLCLFAMAQCLKRDCRRPRPHGSHGTAYTVKQARLAGLATFDLSPDPL